MMKDHKMFHFQSFQLILEIIHLFNITTSFKCIFSNTNNWNWSINSFNVRTISVIVICLGDENPAKSQSLKKEQRLVPMIYNSNEHAALLKMKESTVSNRRNWWRNCQLLKFWAIFKRLHGNWTILKQFSVCNA